MCRVCTGAIAYLTACERNEPICETARDRHLQTVQLVELHEDRNDRRPAPPRGTALTTTDIPALIDKEVS